MNNTYKEVDEIITRAKAIEEEMTQDGADIEALTKEADELIARKKEIIAERAAAEQAILAGAGETIAIVAVIAFIMLILYNIKIYLLNIVLKNK